MFLLIAGVCVALVMSTLAVQRNSAQDRESIREKLIQSCNQFNTTRLSVKNSNEALIAIVAANSDTPDKLSPVMEQFLRYNIEATDPVSCNPDGTGFMRDLTPPSVPPVPPPPPIPGVSS